MVVEFIDQVTKGSATTNSALVNNNTHHFCTNSEAVEGGAKQAYVQPARLWYNSRTKIFARRNAGLNQLAWTIKPNQSVN